MKVYSSKKLLNIIGLLFGLVGVVIIFFYGPPQPSFFPYDIITDDNIHKEILDMRDKYDLCSKIGLGFIFIGFFLQLISIFFSDQLPSKSISDKAESTAKTIDINNSDTNK